MVIDLKGYCLAFDLDGTLVNTAPDLVATLNHVLGAKGIAPLDFDVARDLVGHGARALIQRGFLETGLALDSAQEEAALVHFLAHYHDHIDTHSRPYDGVKDTLTALKSLGASLCVCTNKPQNLSLLLLDKMGLMPYFDAVMGADAVSHKKPDPAHLLACCQAVGISLDKTVLIGDSITDFQTSRNAGVPSILFSFGYSVPKVETLDAEAILGHYDELIPALTRLLTLD